MRLAVFGFVAALLAAPLAAQAAQSPARFSVTLHATLLDRISYERTRSDEECSSRRTGTGGHELTLRSVVPTTIRVSRRGGSTVFRPARVAAVHRSGTSLAASYSEFRRCRFLPPERLSGKCDARPLPAVRGPANLSRPSRNRIVFGRAATRTTTACGLETRLQLAGWLNLAPGAVDERALLSGRALRVRARGSANRELAPPTGDPTLKVTERVVINWTLTFRRLA